jgi:predicted TIM-barrel fold metal-dependent hydrolase
MTSQPTISRREFNGSLLGLAAGLGLVACTTPSANRTSIAIDCHAHVFRRDLPMPDRRRAPTGYDATSDDYLRKLDENNMTHGVLIQPSFLGTDNSYLLSALGKNPQRLRGVVVVDPGISVSELDQLQAAGVVGIRLNLVGLPTPDFSSVAWKNLLSEIKARRWQVEVHRAAGELAAVLDPLMRSGVNVMVDHFGRPDEKSGVDDPGFRYLMALSASRRVWVKLSGAYRNGANGVGEATALQALPLLKTHFGLDRLVWGSDWPHTLFESKVNYSVQRRLLDVWLPDAAERSQVLHQTPAKLFGFEG